MTTRRVAVLTTSRADYGLLYWLLRELDAAAETELQLIVSGSHLSPQFGATATQIEADGFAITARAEILLDSDTAMGMATSFGLGALRFAETLSRLSPDILVVLGDRYEVLSAVATATCLRIPVAHIHGGEATEGAIDDTIRHAISQLAHLHFPAAEPYRQRLLRMGNAPGRVFLTGSPALDNLARLTLPTRRQMAQDLGLDEDRPFLLVTYHPVTLGQDDLLAGGHQLIAALEAFGRHQIVLTRANQDMGGRALNTLFESWAARQPDRVHVVSALGTPRYLAMARDADVVVGNSSSGLIEVPAIGTPVVNIGDRQKGRLRPPAVIDCEERTGAIETAIRTALTTEFKASAASAESPYGRPGASAAIAAILRKVELSGLLLKPFHMGDA